MGVGNPLIIIEVSYREMEESECFQWSSHWQEPLISTQATWLTPGLASAILEFSIYPTSTRGHSWLG